MNDEQATFIINPAAGGVADRGEVESAIRAAFPDASVQHAEQPGSASQLAGEAVRAGCTLLVAAGGDGTLHEVINGLGGDFAGVRAAVLPLGTGNDFARSIGMPQNLAEALALLRRGCTARIDLARVSGPVTRHIINMSGGGFSAVVNEKLTDEVKETWGPLSYARSFLEALPEREAYHSTITLDGTRLDVPAFNIFVANARYVAKGIPIAPRAVLDDGLLDIIVLPVASLARIAVLTPVTLAGAHLDSEDVVFRRARTIRVESEPPMRFNGDGELFPEGALTFECLPRVLQFVIGDLPEENPPLMHDRIPGQ